MKAFQQTVGEPKYHHYTEVFEVADKSELYEKVMKRIQELEGDSDSAAEPENNYPWYSYEIVEDDKEPENVTKKADSETVPKKRRKYYRNENDLDGCIFPLMYFFVTPYAVLFPLFWVPFAFTEIGFPVYSLYVWPFCLLIWVLSMLAAKKCLSEKHFDYFTAVSTIVCALVQTILTFYYSYSNL